MLPVDYFSLVFPAHSVFPAHHPFPTKGREWTWHIEGSDPTQKRSSQCQAALQTKT